MYKPFYLIKVFLVIIAIINQSLQINDFSISEESDEITEINKVVDSVSKEYYDKFEKKKIYKKNGSARKNNKDFSKEISKSTKKAKVNVSSFNCANGAESSSEESQCRNTLVNYPFAASVLKKGAHYTSGALVHRQHVLTVAEEFFKVRETIKLYRVRLGSVNCKKGGVLLPIKLVEIHPQFVSGEPRYDLALLRLATRVDPTEYIKPIPLSQVERGVISAKFLTTYWPRLIVKGTVLPESAKERLKHNSMRVSTQKLIPWAECAALMKARGGPLDKASLCLRPIATHHSVCMPDVGAPVLADDGLWGITSGWTSAHCALYPSPTIFTRTNLQPVRAWVKTIINSVKSKKEKLRVGLSS